MPPSSRKAAKPDPRVTKRRVTMTNLIAVRVPDPDGPEGATKVEARTLTAVDYVRPDILDAYVQDARRRWADVEVSAEPDAGPAGYEGATFVPFGTAVPQVDDNGEWTGGHDFHEFPHTLAGSYFPAADCKNCKHAPEHPLEPGRKARTIQRAEG